MMAEISRIATEAVASFYTVTLLMIIAMTLVIIMFKKDRNKKK